MNKNKLRKQVESRQNLLVCLGFNADSNIQGHISAVRDQKLLISPKVITYPTRFALNHKLEAI